MSYLDTLKRIEECGTPSERPPGNPYMPGAKVGWTRADGSHHTGVIEHLHTDPAGVIWAFLTLPGETWTTVNLARMRAA